MPIIYNSRYTAQKNARYGDRVIKVCGGYIVMGSRESIRFGESRNER